MNRLVIIGNGFDMAHGLKTSYMDFINWYWDSRVKMWENNNSRESKDKLCKITINNGSNILCWSDYYNTISLNNMIKSKDHFGWGIIQKIRDNHRQFTFECSPFFETILQSIEKKGWVDIENDYYQNLKRLLPYNTRDTDIRDLNTQLNILKEYLIKYLGQIEDNSFVDEFHQGIIEAFDPNDFSVEGLKKALDDIGVEKFELDTVCRNAYKMDKLIPTKILLLSFNYTNTAKRYCNFNLDCKYIHGSLDNPQHIIFGYGDELDKNYQDILDLNENELLRNMKSIRYLETTNYRRMLEFIDSAPFQVLIMGHSCGNSDRTLLNTVFEHENCVSIKPFYHKWSNNTDNYLDIVQNISRNFTNMKLFRDRVVNKEQCQQM